MKRFLNLTVTAFFGISLSLFACFSAQAVSKNTCQDRLTSTTATPRGPGTKFQLTEELSRVTASQAEGHWDSATTYIYLGKFGGENYAWNQMSGLRVLSDSEMQEVNLSAPNLPQISKQSSANNCLATAIEFLLQLTLPSNASLRAIPAKNLIDAMTPFLSPWITNPLVTMNPFLSPLIRLPQIQQTVGEAQNNLIAQTLTNAGLKFHQSDKSNEVIEAALMGKKILLGVIAAEYVQWIDRDSGVEHSTAVHALAPYAGGNTGHAMVVVAAYSMGSSAGTMLLLADPLSGGLVIYKTNTFNEISGLQNAFIVP